MYYSKIKHFDPANGPGIRISLFVSGCRFHCFNCFNPETWDFEYGELYTEETKNHILEQLKSPHYDGLSILGGDPLWQMIPGLQYLCELVQEAKKLNKSVWIWSGFTWEGLFNPQYKDYQNHENTYTWRQKLISLCDVWIDGQYIEAKRNLMLPYCGSTNQRVIDVQKSLKEKRVILYNE